MVVKLAEEFATNEIVPVAEKIEHKDWVGHPRAAEESQRSWA